MPFIEMCGQNYNSDSRIETTDEHIKELVETGFDLLVSLVNNGYGVGNRLTSGSLYTIVRNNWVDKEHKLNVKEMLSTQFDAIEAINAGKLPSEPFVYSIQHDAVYGAKVINAFKCSHCEQIIKSASRNRHAGSLECIVTTERNKATRAGYQVILDSKVTKILMESNVDFKLIPTMFEVAVPEWVVTAVESYKANAIDGMSLKDFINKVATKGDNKC